MKAGIPAGHPKAAEGLSTTLSRSWLLRRALARDPRLAVEYVRSLLTAGRGLAEQAERRPPPGAMSPEAARIQIVEAVGPWSEGPALALVRERLGATGHGEDRGGRMAAVMAGDRALGELLYALVRALRPGTVIETGVATGVTSAHILAGLADNRHGRLASIDLPPGDLVSTGLVGSAVPPELRDRWEYHWSTAKRTLPRLLADDGPGPRIFVHDSDHSYANMRWELETAWAALAPGDWLVADDADLHGALSDVAAAVDSVPWLVCQEAEPGTTGLIRR